MRELAEKVSALRWHHSIDLGHGVVTPGAKSLRTLSREHKIVFDPVLVDGATVLDVGAWNGAHSFEAARRGARVLATDHYVWTHEEWRGREGFDLANAALGLNIEAKEADLPDISIEKIGRFDIVLFLGVLYHLPSPLTVLQQIASVAKECLIVETRVGMTWMRKPALAYHPGNSLDGDPTNFFVPNKAFVVEALRECGFVRFDSYYTGRRLTVHAWRGTGLRRLKDEPERNVVNRRLIEHAFLRLTRLRNRNEPKSRTLSLGKLDPEQPPRRKP
jgi:tRNA (mo5U34)-methyltransferase